MSDLSITPEQMLQLADLIEETAKTLTDPKDRKEWKLKAKNLRLYVEVSRHQFDESQRPTKRDMS